MSNTQQQYLFDVLSLNEDGLIPVIAQCVTTHKVLMMAWMNEEALRETLETGKVCYWSRSRQSLWRKGESSEQVQHVKEMRIDCDGDCLLLIVEQEGVACHTGRVSCFYRTVDEDGLLHENQSVVISPDVLYSSQDSVDGGDT